MRNDARYTFTPHVAPFDKLIVPRLGPGGCQSIFENLDSPPSARPQVHLHSSHQHLVYPDTFFRLSAFLQHNRQIAFNGLLHVLLEFFKCFPLRHATRKLRSVSPISTACILMYDDSVFHSGYIIIQTAKQMQRDYLRYPFGYSATPVRLWRNSRRQFGQTPFRATILSLSGEAITGEDWRPKNDGNLDSNTFIRPNTVLGYDIKKVRNI